MHDGILRLMKMLSSVESTTADNDSFSRDVCYWMLWSSSLQSKLTSFSGFDNFNKDIKDNSSEPKSTSSYGGSLSTPSTCKLFFNERHDVLDWLVLSLSLVALVASPEETSSLMTRRD
jgi:hypothetical protein